MATVATSTAAETMATGSSEIASDTAEEEDFYIQCDAPNCDEWYEGSSLSPPITPAIASSFETWHCPSCIPFHGPSTIKSCATSSTRRQGLRKKRRIDFVKLNDPAALLESESNRIGVAANDVQEVDFGAKLQLRRKKGMFTRGGVLRAGTEVFDTRYVDRHGFNQPVLFASQLPFQIGLKLPGKDGTAPFSFDSVAKLVGPYRTTQVIDTATQLTTTYTLQEWVEYLNTPEKERSRILNVITLEYSQTPLGKLVTEPTFAREVDFVPQCWPGTVDDLKRILEHGRGGKKKNSNSSSSSSNNNNNNNSSCDGNSNNNDREEENEEDENDEEDLEELLKELQEEIPRVSKYCLMSASGSYTDFHVDFGGTAVWYHVYFGQKIFFFIEPTPKNLKIYSEWATNGGRGSKKTANNAFLPDLITAAGGEVFEVHLKKGQTMFIPSGWIHAVFTPKDSLVFGGNFVHRHSLEMQLNIFRLEKRMKVGKDYKFPCYQKLMWFVAWDFLKECDDLMMQINCGISSGGGKEEKDDVMRKEQLMMKQICGKYPAHVLLGYNALAKELESWARSKQKLTTDQFPENMDVSKVAMQLGGLLTKCVAYLGIDKKAEKKTKVKKKPQHDKKRQNSQISHQKKPVITPMKSSSSSSPPASKKCKVEGCTQYKRSKCDGYCATHYREKLSLQSGGAIDLCPPPGRECKKNGCNKYKKSKCEGYCLMCFRASVERSRS